MRGYLPLLLTVCLGCPQTVVVIGDDAGPDGGAADQGLTSNDAEAADATDTDDDAGIGDGETSLDAGPGACADPDLCLQLTPEPARVNLRELATVRAQLDNPEGRIVRVEFCEPTPRTTRLPGRPALVLDEIEYELRLDDTTGAFTFQVLTVPPWFMATDFNFEVCVYADQQTTPSQRVPVLVHVRGNVVFSAQYQGVFAVGSDGRPAEGKDGAYPSGTLLYDTIGRATALHMASDGTLLVLDEDASPPRIARYELTAQDYKVATFAHLAKDLNGAEPLYYDNIAIHSLSEMPNGVVLMADTHNSGTENPRVMMWNPDGTFRRQVRGPEIYDLWHAVAARSNDELLVARTLNIQGAVLRLDPQTADALPGGPLTDDLRKIVWDILPLKDGRIALAGERLAMFVTSAGGAMTVNNLPSGTSQNWRAVAQFDDTLLFANEHQGANENIAVVSGTRFVRWLRSASGPVTVPYGLAYLE